MAICRHPKLIEVDNISLVEFQVESQPGSVVGAFQWKKYTCENCGNLITILNAVVEKLATDK